MQLPCKDNAPPRKPPATGAFRKTGKSTNFLKRSIFFLKPSARIQWKTPPDKQDVEGSGDITNIACNTWVVQRNYQKERDLADAEYKLSLEKNPKKRVDMEAEIDMIRHKPDAMWIVRAQRWGDGSTPQKFLYFNKESWTYSEVYNFIPQRLVEV